MAKRQRRSFSDKFKRDLIAQITGGARVTDLAKKHKIQASQISMWKRKYGAGKASAPAKRGRPAGSTKKAAAKAPVAAAAPARSSNSNNRIADLERMIGQLTIENARLKGEL